MKIAEADVVWTPHYVEAPYAGEVRVERHGSHWPRRTQGDLWARAHDQFYNVSKPSQLLTLFALFNKMVIRDGIDPMVAHNALLAIDEYRRALSRDTPGAE